MNDSSTRPRTLVVSNVAWDYLWQRHQSLASLLARDDDVTYCEMPGLRRIGWRDTGRLLQRLSRMLRPRRTAPRHPPPPGLTIVRPFIAPSTNAIFHAFNRATLRSFLRRHPTLAAGIDTIITYTAARSALHLIAHVPHRRLVYECTDNFGAIARLPACFSTDESTLLRTADLTVVPGPTLAGLHRATARRLEVLPHGAFIERFLLPPPTMPPAPPQLVYYGHVYRQHLDCDLIEAIARARPEWRITLVGPVLSPTAFPANVTLAGPQLHDRLADFLREAHVIILPYARNDYTRTVLPAKTYECLATGRPVIATPLPDLQAMIPDLITYATGADDFVAAIERVLHDDSPATREARIATARAATWEQRCTQLRALIDGLPPA